MRGFFFFKCSEPVWSSWICPQWVASGSSLNAIEVPGCLPVREGILSVTTVPAFDRIDKSIINWGEQMADKVIVLIKSSIPTEGTKKLQRLLFRKLQCSQILPSFCSAVLIILVFIFKMAETAPVILFSQWNMQLQKNTNPFLT